MEASTSGRGSFRERSSVGYWFSKLFFRDVPATVRDCTRTCGLGRSSRSDTGHPDLGSLSYFVPGIIFWLSCPLFLRNFGDVLQVYFRDHRAWWLTVSWGSWLILFCTSLCSLRLPYWTKKIRNSVENWISFLMIMPSSGNKMFDKLGNKHW